MARGFEKIDRQESSSRRMHTVRFEAWDLPPYQPKPMLPPELPSSPEIIYSTATSWQSVARWYANATEPILSDNNASPAALLPEQERVAKTSAILAEIQKTVRYTGLELGMAAYIPPHTPAETLARGYGDCKDKATLLASRLRAAGIPAKLALLTAYPFPDVTPAMPGLESFNHVIVYVAGQHPLWIDPTSQYSGAARLPQADAGRSALIADAASISLVHTPESTAVDNHSADDVSITLQPQGKATIAGVETYTGAWEGPRALITVCGFARRQVNMKAS